MAHIRVEGGQQLIDDPVAIGEFLAPFGIQHDRWELNDGPDPGAPAEEILAAYAPQIDRLKRAGGYVTADVIDVTPSTPNLDTLLNRFNKEHTHSEDEVRFIVRGRGVFHIHPDNGPVFSIETEAGDMINVPAGTKHWFDLCSERNIRAIRLFRDTSGWSPAYTQSDMHEKYIPVCWGPAFLAPQKPFEPSVRI